MDGELGGDTGRFILRRLEASDELRATWARYHLIRDCVRYQDRGLAHNSLGDRVRVAIDGLDAPEQAGSTAGPRWLRPVAGLAVAATVALMAVIAVSPNLTGVGADGTAQTASVESQPFTSPNYLSRGPASRPVNLSGTEQRDDAKLNSYLLRHYQVAGSSGGNGFVSFVPIVIARSSGQDVARNDNEPAPAETQDSTPAEQ